MHRAQSTEYRAQGAKCAQCLYFSKYRLQSYARGCTMLVQRAQVQNQSLASLGYLLATHLLLFVKRRHRRHCLRRRPAARVPLSLVLAAVW